MDKGGRRNTAAIEFSVRSQPCATRLMLLPRGTPSPSPSHSRSLSLFVARGTSSILYRNLFERSAQWDRYSQRDGRESYRSPKRRSRYESSGEVYDREELAKHSPSIVYRGRPRNYRDSVYGKITRPARITRRRRWKGGREGFTVREEEKHGGEALLLTRKRNNSHWRANRTNTQNARSFPAAAPARINGHLCSSCLRDSRPMGIYRTVKGSSPRLDETLENTRRLATLGTRTRAFNDRIREYRRGSFDEKLEAG